MKNMDSPRKEWEPIPQRKPHREMQDELQIEIPPDAPQPPKKPKPEYEKGEGIDITPSDSRGDINGEEEED